MFYPINFTHRMKYRLRVKREASAKEIGREGVYMRIRTRTRGSVFHRFGAEWTSRWWSIFSIGILIGAVIVIVRLSAVEALTGKSEQIQGERQQTGIAVRNVQEETNQTEQPGRATVLGAREGQEQEQEKEREKEQEQLVRVYITEENRVETVPLESYVKGVLAAEMPISFELEALKAQAIAARTYIMRRLTLHNDSEMEKKQADVLDTVQHQVYIPAEQLEDRWEGEEKKKNMAKLQRAVDETKGQIITYDGEPIEAVFFSTSNGYTENSEDYWGQPVPYLRSVASPWDKAQSPRYEESQTFQKEELYRRLGLTGKKAGSKLTMKVIEKTEGNRIKSIKINGELFSGREVRERLGLASSQFSWKIQKDNVTITTTGFGHGVGMSQWGANGMAKEGKTAEQILHHYYTDTILSKN